MLPPADPLVDLVDAIPEAAAAAVPVTVPVTVPAAVPDTGHGPVDQVLALVRAGRVVEALSALTRLRGQGLDDREGVRAAAATIECRLARGDLGDAVTLSDRLAAYTAGPDDVAAVAHYARAEVSAALGDVEPALERFAAAGDALARVLPVPAHVLEVPWRSGAALASVRAGRFREGADLAREHLVVAEASGSPYAVAGALRALATADSGARRTELLRAARTTLADAARDGVRAERLAAQLDTDLAGLLILTPGRDAAREAVGLLRGAEEYAGRQELWPLQGRVRRLLDQLGERPRRVQSEALAALTASERRVAGLAADGLTNRQIAEQLLVTVKAVEWHLSHVYRKLGITSRTRLAGALGA
ncbi:LuxR family transcriptional regulator [Nocardioides abyssi]|uniref:LuxR C-terminal-related transcriptional regulator n=1 Tax=Nocardioides abyssi TaxID=3058370 RepID=A0ABT8ESM0_9ACTN|nr:LuxR family transcriptional regulator [Nocardioides abyssi]MDN4161028.1 LuxR C-terminal-related transcriptional regulator [Nocardioides abyssi]